MSEPRYQYDLASVSALSYTVDVEIDKRRGIHLTSMKWSPCLRLKYFGPLLRDDYASFRSRAFCCRVFRRRPFSGLFHLGGLSQPYRYCPAIPLRDDINYDVPTGTRNVLDSAYLFELNKAQHPRVQL